MTKQKFYINCYFSDVEKASHTPTSLSAWTSRRPAAPGAEGDLWYNPPPFSKRMWKPGCMNRCILDRSHLFVWVTCSPPQDCLCPLKDCFGPSQRKGGWLCFYTAATAQMIGEPKGSCIDVVRLNVGHHLNFVKLIILKDKLASRYCSLYENY